MKESDYERVYGRNPVMEALKGSRNVNRVLLAKGNTDYTLAAIANLARDKGISVQYTDRRKLDTITNGARHQGVLAYCSPVAYVGLDDLLEIAARRNEKPFLVMLDSVTDPHNVGAVIRSACGAGCHGVIVAKRRAAAITDTVAKASAGSVERIAIAQVSNLNQALETLKKQGIFAIASDKAGTDYIELDYDMPLVLVVGSEGSGVSHLLKSNCDFVATIPMQGGLESLNCSVAAGILLYEAAKARWHK